MREGNINLVFHLFMHSLADPCMGPDKGSNDGTRYSVGWSIPEMPGLWVGQVSQLLSSA